MSTSIINASSQVSIISGFQIPELNLPSINYDALFRERSQRVFHISDDNKHYNQRDLVEFRGRSLFNNQRALTDICNTF